MTTLISGRIARLDDTEYFAMTEAGVFGDRRVFLWAGRLCEKMAKTRAHAFVEGTLADASRAVVPAPWLVRGENPLRLGGKYIPLPDILVVRGPWTAYRDRRPGPADVGLVVEVAVTNLGHDLGVQAAHYARAGVACYWVVDPGSRRVVAHREPSAEGTFASVVTHGPGDRIDVVLDGVVVGQVAVSDLF